LASDTRGHELDLWDGLECPQPGYSWDDTSFGKADAVVTSDGKILQKAKDRVKD
jgi:hypothetical protein